MLELQIMLEKEFQAYLELAIPDYAQDKVISGTWKIEESLKLAQESFGKFLPHGIKTKKEYLYTINLEGKRIGFMWLHYDSEEVDSAFIYDFMVDEGYQGRGYGQEAMELMFETVKELGAKKLSLHVFGHNKRALYIYEKLGFGITDYSMSRDIN